ncbi:MAG: TIGR02680 family protein [Actinomycetota bacterium]
MSERASTGRWQPQRAGLVNVWRYADEVLTFHRGRLLLRGANGSGKSMALELLFPFLLDANAQPGRLSSAGKARGGLYERLTTGLGGGDRVGFLWAEFARPPTGDGTGDGGTFTIGVRLRASAQTHKVDYGWFTTTMVVGRDLRLLDDHRVPLSRAGLEEALAGAGTVHTNADDYRRAVRTHLFPGCDERQYDAIITTLLTLRREKISQDLDPQKLSSVLTASLPPLDEHDVAEVAEGFQKLDRRKEDLDKLAADLEVVRRLARRQRAYARSVLWGLAAEVRGATNRRDDVTRRARTAATRLASARDESATVEAAEAAARSGAADLRAQADTLRNLDAYRAGGRIEALRSEAERAAERARREEAVQAARGAEAERRAAAADDCRGQVADARAAARRATADLSSAADEADALAALSEAEASEPDAGERLLQAWAESRRQAVTEVRQALAHLARCVDARQRADEVLEEERAVLDGAVESHRGASSHLAQAVQAYSASVDQWAASAPRLEAWCLGEDGPGLAARLPSPPDDPAAVDEVVEALAVAARSAGAVASDRLRSALAANASARTAVEVEREEVAGGRLRHPLPPPWRSPRPEGSEGRDGAALWQLVDVAPGVEADVLDGVEAALVASGLLDAWVSPGGEISLPADERHDVVLGLVPAGHGGGSLADVLVPADGPRPAVAAEVVAALLRSIALVPTVDAEMAAGQGSAAAVGRDGTFCLGPTVGRGPSGPAQFVGAVAQEHRRLRRLAELDDQLAVLDRERSDLDKRLASERAALAALETEVAARPSGEAIAAAERHLEIAEARVADARARTERAQAARARAEEEAKAAQRDLMQRASAHGVPADPPGLEAHDARVRAVERLAVAWSRRRREEAAATLGLARAVDESGRAAAALGEAVRHYQSAVDDHRQLVARLEALDASAGAEYRAVLQQVQQAEAEAARLGSERDAAARRLRELAGETGRLEAELAAVEAERGRAEAERDAAAAGLVAAVSDGMAADAGVDVPDDPAGAGVTAVLEAARAVLSTVGENEGSDRERQARDRRLQESVYEARQSLRGGVDVLLDQSPGGWWALRAVAGGLRHRAHELAASLAGEVAAANDELREEEHRLFDETLTGSVRRSVAERIRRSNELVDGINVELAKVRTTTAGVGVRLRWEVEPDQPEVVKGARRLLLKDPADLSDTERASLYEFFRARLDDARQALDGTAGWDERLRDALDYRRWHRFALEVAHRDWDGFVPATTHRLARLSTGERSVTLHLPMLASVAAHYDGLAVGDGPSPCPRLILLDELFAGVDVVNRGQLFGLFVAWDLDAVVTSDHEWCAYQSLDGIAIHHLHATEPGQPVTTSRFVWDGRENRASPLAVVGG